MKIKIEHNYFIENDYAQPGTAARAAITIDDITYRSVDHIRDYLRATLKDAAPAIRLTITGKSKIISYDITQQAGDNVRISVIRYKKTGGTCNSLTGSKYNMLLTLSSLLLYIAGRADYEAGDYYYDLFNSMS